MSKREKTMSEKENERVGIKRKKCQKWTDVGESHNYPQEIFSASDILLNLLPKI